MLPFGRASRVISTKSMKYETVKDKVVPVHARSHTGGDEV